MDKEAKVKMEQAIEDCLDNLNDPNIDEQDKVVFAQKLDLLAKVQNESEKTEADIKKGKHEIANKHLDLISRVGLGVVSVLGSLGVMGMIKDIETESTIRSRMFPIALQNIQKIFRL